MPEPTTIRTERLILRPFSFDDIDDVVAYANDPEWSQFMPIPYPYGQADAEQFVARQVFRDWNEKPSFAIELDDQVVGAIELGIEAPISVASLHYAIARRHWNKGLTTEAAKAVVDWAFETVGVEKVYSWADVENVGSWRVMEKIGMTREGTLRSQGVNRGVRQDYHYYGILRSEWEQQRDDVQ